MKGFKDSNNKFHPITDYKKGVRKSRDTTEKTHGVKIRKARNRFHPKGYKPPTFGKKKPAGTWEITKTDYGSSSKNVEITKDHVVIFDDDGREVVYWDKKEWKDEPEIKPIIKNYIKLANQGKVEEIKEAIKPRPEQRWDFNQRKARTVSKIKIIQPIMKEKLDSIFYDGEIATLKAKDGSIFELSATGEVGFFIDGKWFPDVRDAESEFGLNDSVLAKLNNSGRIEFSNNNWFEISAIKGKTKEYSDYYSEPIEDYDSAIEQLKQEVKDYERGDIEI